MYSIKKFSIFWKLSGKLDDPPGACAHTKVLSACDALFWALISQTYQCQRQKVVERLLVVERLFMQDASLVAAIS